MGFLSWLTRSSLKVGAVAAAVKISIDNDVWTLNTKDGESTYIKLRENIIPGSIVFKEKIPSKDELEIDTGSKWNDGVNCAFDYINAAPEKINKKLNSFYKPSEVAKA